MPNITGEESAADLVQMAIEEFSSYRVQAGWGDHARIIYQDNLPFLQFKAEVRNNYGDFVCLYRLDKILAAVVPECGKIYEQADAAGFFGEGRDKNRGKVVNRLALYAMRIMLLRLMYHQVAMLEDTLKESMFLTTGMLYSSLASSYQSPDGKGIIKETNAAVRKLLDGAVDNATKQKRETLVALLNTLPPLRMQTSAGRPKGSTKPEDVKAREAAEFEKEIEATIRSLRLPTGEMPKKTAVAKALKIGGLSPKTGIDSSLSAFRNKLDRLNVDYNAIVERVRLNK